jgi:hypothetical protein
MRLKGIINSGKKESRKLRSAKKIKQRYDRGIRRSLNERAATADNPNKITGK